tara:strand:+ start:191 stop:2197 length:2007 start_codon:yes stop_codon:yes gene_type:complete
MIKKMIFYFAFSLKLIATPFPHEEDNLSENYMVLSRVDVSDFQKRRPINDLVRKRYKYKPNFMRDAASISLGVSSAVVWGHLFVNDQNTLRFLYGEGEGYVTVDSVLYPMALVMVLPNTFVLNDLIDDISAIAKGLQGSRKKKVFKGALQAANFVLAGQASYSAWAVYANTQWNSPRKEIRNNVNDSAYYLAGCYVLTTFLDQLSTGNGIIERVSNGWQHWAGRKALADQVKKDVLTDLQSQLMHSYMALNDLSDQEMLSLRRIIGDIHKNAKTDEEKQKAKLLSLIAILDLGKEKEEVWQSHKKPLSLMASEIIGGSLGAAVLPWAIFSSYWVFDQDNRVLPDGRYNFLQPLDSPDAWAYSSVYGLYLAGTGLMGGRELGRKVWSDWTGVDLNQFRAAPEFNPQNLRGVRALTRVATYGLSNILVIPIAGMATELLFTAEYSISKNTYQYNHQQLIMLSVINWAVGFHGAFDEHYQKVISNMARWRGTDPLTTARDDLRKMVIEFHDGIGDLDPEQTQSLSELLQKARAAEAAEDVRAAAGDGVAGDDGVAESSFSSEDSGEGAGAGPDAVAVDMGDLAEETAVDGDNGLRAELLSVAQRAASGSGPGAGEEIDYALGEEEGARLLAESEQVQGKGWFTRLRTRIGTWLLGPDVPASLQGLVDTIPA